MSTDCAAYLLLDPAPNADIVIETLSQLSFYSQGMPVLAIDDLQSGEWAEVLDVEGNASQVHRLHELGLRQGARLQMLQAGSPCIFRLGNARLSLRLERGLRLWVRLVDEPSSLCVEVA